MVSQDLQVDQSLSGFVIERIEDIPELRSQAVVLTHEKTGARAMHLFNEDPNNLFCIAFRTPVFNDTGVPHILEHSVLSGSRKFPLKDPFKELLKGSLQTFLNALTYPDKTMYPVSSQVERDFFNLVDVYCDAVFHPLLTETTFLQEGWHYDVEDVNGPVGIKGIVYNEMKGVFSDFRSHVGRRTFSALFPDTTYFYESGGDPEHIPELTYEDFKAFHAKFYHPANSFIFLYGNIPTAKTLEFLECRYLSDFGPRDVDSTVHRQEKWVQPRTLEITAPSSKEDDGTASVNVCWLFGDSTDPVNALLGRIFSQYLLGTESSPLKRALVDSGLGEDLDDMSGFDSDLVQGLFAAGLRKCKPENADKIKKIIIDTLSRQAEHGLDEELLEGVIRQTEFRLREISEGGHFPYNLMLAERCYRSWLYEGDPLSHLKFEHPLEIIKGHKKEGVSFFNEKIRELFVDNPHCLLSVVTASSKMGEELGKQTEAQAKRLTENFGEEELGKIKEITDKLRMEQKTPASPEVLAKLPRLDKKDLPKENEVVPTDDLDIVGVPCHAHDMFTAGIAYVDLSFDLSVLTRDELLYFPLFSELLTRCGAAGHSYEQMAKRISLSTGGVSSSHHSLTVAPEGHDISTRFFMHAKCLEDRYRETLDILRDILTDPRLDDKKQVRDTLVEMRNDLAAAAVRSGHTFAILKGASLLSPSRYIDELLGGITQLRFVDRVLKEDSIDTVVSMIQTLRTRLVCRDACHVSLTSETPEKLVPGMASFLGCLPAQAAGKAQVEFAAKADAKPCGIEIASSVNYVARTWLLRDCAAGDYGLLQLLARNLSTGYLWEKIRVEGGAYGGMAMGSSAHPVFSCASYRDPNLSKTLEHFKEGLSLIAKGLSQDEIDQSIIGTIGRMDSPRSPRSKGLGETVSLLTGRTVEYRQRIREGVLAATPDSLAETAQRILDTQESVVTVLGSADAFEQANTDGVTLDREPLMP